MGVAAGLAALAAGPTVVALAETQSKKDKFQKEEAAYAAAIEEFKIFLQDREEIARFCSEHRDILNRFLTEWFPAKLRDRERLVQGQIDGLQAQHARATAHFAAIISGLRNLSEGQRAALEVEHKTKIAKMEAAIRELEEKALSPIQKTLERVPELAARLEEARSLELQALELKRQYALLEEGERRADEGSALAEAIHAEVGVAVREILQIYEESERQLAARGEAALLVAPNG